MMDHPGSGGDLAAQSDALKSILPAQAGFGEILRGLNDLGLPNWCIGAGYIAQTIWNRLSGYPIESSIRDVDVVYFDPANLSDRMETGAEEHLASRFPDLPFQFDVKNQARVHLWYKQRFGYEIEPYTSIESAIATWPTTATSIAVTDRGGQFRIFAPYGLNDLFGMIVRPNKTQITQAIYEAKARRWKQAWPNLTILPW